MQIVTNVLSLTNDELETTKKEENIIHSRTAQNG